MKSLLLFLTKPFSLFILWLGFATTLWASMMPNSIPAHLLNEVPLSLTYILLFFIGILSSLSLWNARYSQAFIATLETQTQEHKKATRALKKQHQTETHQIRTLIENGQFAYWEWNIKSNKAEFSPQWKKMVGLPADAPLNNLHDLQERIHPKDQASVQQDFFRALSGEDEFLECTHRAKHEDGHYIWVHDKGQVFYADDGEIDKLCAIRLDVSEQKWIEGELEIDASIIEHASEGIAIIDADFNITRTNEALKTTINTIHNQFDVADLQTLLGILQTNPSLSIIDSLKKRGNWLGELCLFNGENGPMLASRVSIQKLFHDTTQSVLYSFIHSDITDLKRTQRALDNLANIDGVTGLANRNKLYKSLETVLKSEQPTNLMFLDLDNFKFVNDTLGHDIGDLLLKEVGQAITELLPSSALLTRIGGDEFVLYYPQSSLDSEDINQPPQALAQQIIDRLAQRFVVDQNDIHIGSSIGIAQYPQHANDRYSLLKVADMAMYQAKHSGKGRFCMYTPEAP